MSDEAKPPDTAPAPPKAPPKKAPLVYLAAPTKGRTLWDATQSVRRAEFFSLIVALNGGIPVCPAVMYQHFDRQITEQFWVEAGRELLARCDAIIAIPGHQRAPGAVMDVAAAKEMNMPFLVFEDTRDAYPTDDVKKHIGNFLYSALGVIPPSFPGGKGTPPSGAVS